MTFDISANSAIQAALQQDWKKAIEINTAILKNDKVNLDATNRLAFAYLKTGQIKEAKLFFNKVLKLDPYNQIAQKNLKKLDLVHQKDLIGGKIITTPMSPLVFLEEPGKTKIVVCVNPAPGKIISILIPGQEVFLKPKKHSVEVRDENDNYLAALPDDLSFKLIKFLSGGNTYVAVIKSIGKNSLTVLLREVSRSKKFANQPSFSSSISYLAFSPNGANSEEKPDVAATGEEEEPEKTEEN